MGNDKSRADALEGKVKRQAITERMKVDCLLIRGSIFCGLCGGKLFWGDELEWDHIQALVHEGEHSAWNIRPVHPACHKAKTKKDVTANAKVKRIRGETCNGPKKKLPSRPFPEPPPGWSGFKRKVSP